jgi:glycosyltransferase involved in cell wall biosynthesis
LIIADIYLIDEMKRILIINKSQFGYHTDYYFFCKYLRSDFLVTLLCMDYSLPRISLPGVHVKYISRHRIKLIRSLNFLWLIAKEIRLRHNDLIFIYYFNFCSVLRLIFPGRLFVLDVRTSSIHKNPFTRWIWNFKLRTELKLFLNRTVISESLAIKLGLKPGHFHLLPLGAEEISPVIKNYNEFNLLYVGTFISRNIHETIKGFKNFYDDYSDLVGITYTIIGYGKEEDETVICRLIDEFNLKSIVNFIGQVPYTRLKEYFDRCNVGITYIPVTRYYDCQPSTKTFEYIMSGLYCIATDTIENKKVIREENGILCSDTPESFYKALKKLLENRNKLHDDVIRNSLESYKWEKIVLENFKPYINTLLHV